MSDLTPRQRQILELIRSSNQNVPEGGIHLLETVGDDRTKYSSVYTVLDIVPPPVDMPDPTDEAMDERVEYLHQHTVGYFTIVGPLKED